LTGDVSFISGKIGRITNALPHAKFASANIDANMSTVFESSREVILRTKNWPQAIRFYGSVFGLPVTHRDERIIGFETGSFCLYVEKGDDHGPVFEFLVQDVQAAKQELVAAGCVVIEEDPSLPRCYVRDPFGLVFNIGRAPAAA
jgi:predicted enzyme related to lactoylglutathione lyase